LRLYQDLICDIFIPMGSNQSKAYINQLSLRPYLLIAFAETHFIIVSSQHVQNNAYFIGAWCICEVIYL